MACQHCCISAPTAGPDQKRKFHASGPRRHLQSLSEEIDKTLLQRLVADALDILVQRRQESGSARETIISLPLLMRQLERLLTIGISMALQSRITALRSSGFHAMLDEAIWFVTGKKNTHDDPDEWMDRESPLLKAQGAEISRPVSLELLQVAMLSLASQVPECDHSLTRMALSYRGLIEVASQGACCCFWASEYQAESKKQSVVDQILTPRIGIQPGTELVAKDADRSYLSRPRTPVEDHAESNHDNLASVSGASSSARSPHNSDSAPDKVQERKVGDPQTMPSPCPSPVRSAENIAGSAGATPHGSSCLQAWEMLAAIERMASDLRSARETLTVALSQQDANSARSRQEMEAIQGNLAREAKRLWQTSNVALSSLEQICGIPPIEEHETDQTDWIQPASHRVR